MGETHISLVGEAMLSKSLIQFSAVCWDCVPSLWFGLRPNYDRGKVVMATSVKRFMPPHWLSGLLPSVPPGLAADHCQPMLLLETP